MTNVTRTAETLAAQAIECADGLAALITGFAEEGETEIARAYAEVALTMRMIAEALKRNEDTVKLADRLDSATARTRALVAARRGQ